MRGGVKLLVQTVREAVWVWKSHNPPQRAGKVQALICSTLFYLCDFSLPVDEVIDVLLSWQLWSEKEGVEEKGPLIGCLLSFFMLDEGCYLVCEFL